MVAIRAMGVQGVECAGRIPTALNVHPTFLSEEIG
jgi:hypothetical protein